MQRETEVQSRTGQLDLLEPKEIKLPLEELFTTVQGEGSNTGLAATFIRLWGCPVGCYYCDQGYSQANIYGRENKREFLEISKILSKVEANPQFVVVTGGEPFIHPGLAQLVDGLYSLGKRVQIETSGTFYVELPKQTWITLSPKEHITECKTIDYFWGRANEIKLVVSDGSEIEYYEQKLLNASCSVFLQPEWDKINNNSAEIMPIVLEALNKHPTWRLSLQTHKYIGLR